MGNGANYMEKNRNCSHVKMKHNDTMCLTKLYVAFEETGTEV